MEAKDAQKKLIETLRRFDTVMVTTTASNGSMHARPMAVAEVDDTGEMWFVTARDSAKLDELAADARAVITGQHGGRYCSLSGRIDVIHDRERVRAMWKEAWRVWFPEGKDDEAIVVLRLRPEIGEYWDNRGGAGVRYLFEAARALLDGRSVDDDVAGPEHHAKVSLP